MAQHIRLRRPEAPKPDPIVQKPPRHSGILQDQLRRAARPPWSPSFSLALRLLLIIRVSGAMYSNIDDCDEVFNFWEPLHFFHRGIGFQTWEVSPQYAIRSWSYILLHLPAAHLGFLLSGGSKRAAFFGVRVFLAFLSSFSEVTLYRNVYEKVNERVGRYLFFILLFNAGLWNASAAFLPSSFAMYTTTLAFAASIGPASAQGSHRTRAATLLFATGAIVGWPFAIALAIPFVFEQLFIFGKDKVASGSYVSWILSRWKRLFTFGILASMLFIPVIGLDSVAYGKLAIVPWNIVSYNLFSSDRGPELYGTSPWHFYIFNLLLNFNVLLPFALLSLPALFATSFVDRKRLGIYKPSKEESSPFTILALKLAPFYVWFAILSSQPHKEERFMFPAYTMLCFNAAVTIYLVRGWMEATFISLTKSPYRASQSSIFSNFTSSVVICSALLSLSRIMANWNYYHAPMSVTFHLESKELPNLLNTTNLLPPLPVPTSLYDKREDRKPRVDLTPVKILNLTLCTGKEWHRFPGHYLVPDGVRVEFIKSEFRGLLPGQFVHDLAFDAHPSPLARWWPRAETQHISRDQNDMNREEPSHYIPVSECDYLIDLDFPLDPSASALEPRYAADEQWERVACYPFLDARNSPMISRTLWLPGQRWRALNSWGDYCLLKNKKLVAQKMKKVIKIKS
ncbi:glycosyltransferase family 22 protein [Mycena floridula]|nr:glycosyltransferase family 22 protein [Mycena floridula]